MDSQTVGVIVIGALLVLILLRVPVGLALLTAGFGGYVYLGGLDVALAQLGVNAFSTVSAYSLSVIPLFVLMGMFLSHSGIGGELYGVIDSWVGHVRGGLAIATVAACGLFAAISGSTTATAATMGRVALPEMEARNYAPSLATASVAAGGTLGILIPPSVVLIIYGILTMEPVAQLLVAGVLPGVLLMLAYMISVYVQVRRNPGLAPSGERRETKHRFRELYKVWPVVALFGLVIGGMYFGFFTPTEAAGVGAFGALAISFLTRRIGWHGILGSLGEGARITAMLFLVLIGANVFSQFLAITRIPMRLVETVGNMGLPPYVVIAMLMLMYLILGFFMDGLAVLVLTVPIVYPLIIALGFNGLWFGIIVVLMLEVGLLTPPLGLNVYVVSTISKETPLETIFRGVVPFWVAALITAVIVVLIPQIVLLLPGAM